ncbi:MAG: hypothetical protein Q8Q23_00090 [bacterium]|nr:hypothetical protein [bacterium]
MSSSSQFIYCPRCGGTGKDNEAADKGHNLVCKECYDIGLGTFIKNDFLFWGYDLMFGKIIVRHAKRVFDNAITGIFLIFGFAGIIALAWWLKENAVSSGFNVNIGVILTFWGYQATEILFFWIGALLLIFVYFRYHHAKEDKQIVKPSIYPEIIKLKKIKQNIPNNWQELKRFKTKIDVSKSYDDDLLTIIERAYELAVNLKQKVVLPIHVLAVILMEQKNGSAAKTKKEKFFIKSRKTLNFVFARLGIYQGKILPKIEQALGQVPAQEWSKTGRQTLAKIKLVTVISSQLRRSLVEAYLHAYDAGRSKVYFANLVGYLVANDPLLSNIFSSLDVDVEKIQKTAMWSIMSDNFIEEKEVKKDIFWQKIQFKMKESTMAVATPLLNYFGTNITRETIFKIDSIIIDDSAISENFFDLFTEKKRQIIFSGPTGVGKTSIIYNLAERIINYDVPVALQGYQLFLLDNEKFYNEARQLSVEKKVLGMIAELKHAYKVILVIEDVNDEFINIINKYQGEFACLMTVAHLPAGNELPVINVAEPTGLMLRQILISQTLFLEKKYGVFYSNEAIDLLVDAAELYINDEILPTAAINILKTVGESKINSTNKNITKREIAQAISEKVGVPFTKILRLET